ncbi:MAG: hypothetical protein GX102_10960 [Porphyromonadaceae bacterium]|nr:hypothetical protein [Porphyromonadaceae bacterium]
MKNLFLTLFVLVLVSCTNNPPSLEVQGKWKLVKVENTFALQSTDYSSENIIFDFSSSTVTVSGNTSANFYIADGEYPYTLSMENSLSTTFQTMTLTLKGEQYVYKRENNKMSLSLGYIDGDNLSFERQ